MKILISQSQLKLLMESEMVDGYDLSKIKKAIRILTQISPSFGEFIPLKFKLYGYHINRGGNSKVMVLFIDVDTEDGKTYDPPSGIWYEIGQELMDLFRMLKIRDEKYMNPLYDFKFNKRSLEDIVIL